MEVVLGEVDEFRGELTVVPGDVEMDLREEEAVLGGEVEIKEAVEGRRIGGFGRGGRFW